MGYGKERIIADSAEPKSIDELKALGIRAKGAAKGKDSIKNGIQWIQNFEIIIHPNCPKTYEEFTLYSFVKDKDGKLTDKLEDANCHCIDSLRYSCNDLIRSKKKSRIRTW